MKPFTKIASIIFGIIALLHLLRITFFQIEVFIGEFQLPLWVSIAGFVVTFILCIALWKESNRKF